MRLRRLLTMGISELAVRGRQEAWKWLERRSAGNVNGRPGAIFRHIASGTASGAIERRVRQGDLAGASRVLLEDFRETWPGRFFPGASSPETPTALAAQLAGAGDEAVRIAEAARQGRFDVFGCRGLFFGDPVDWHRDPLSGRRAPLAHWSRLDPLDAATVGDSKIVWEPNRHQWLVRLGQAYQLTGDERYAEAFATCIRDWMRANPAGRGINWASSLEVALRLISWCWALSFLRRSAGLGPGLFAEILGGIWAHASHVERYLSYYFAPNTHLTGEALGLFYAGVLFPQLRPARRWRERSARILTEQSAKQVLPDGVYFEQSTCYQRYTVDIYLHFLMLAARNGLAVPPAVAERVQRMLDFLLTLRRPDGSIPQIGDADGGWLLPLASRPTDDFRGVFSTAAVWFARDDYAWAAGGLAPETLWLLGRPAAKAFAALRPAPPATAPSRLFPHGGYAVMRSGWDDEAHHLIFDGGSLGDPMNAGHGHADLLSIQCSVFGHPYLVDAGTYCYTGDRQWRDFFRSTAAHSTVMVDGLSQAAPAGPFHWQSLPGARMRRWGSTERLDVAEAEHEAYGRLADPVTHRRRVLFVKPRYWVVVDDLQGAAEHRLELRFQFAPMPVTVDAALWARAKDPRGHGLFIRPFATVPLKAEVIEGEIAPIQGWVSPNYGQRRPAPVLIYTTVTPLPLRIATLLCPAKDASGTFPAVSALVGDGPGPVGLVFGDGQECIRFEGPEGITLR